MTLAIQRLEHSIGTPVLIRSKKGVTLTQAGKQLLTHTRGLIQSWENVKTRALASTNQVQGKYIIGCHPSVALYSLPGFLPELLEKYPEIEIKLVHDLSRKVTEAVIHMDIDLGITVNPVRHPDLVIRRLGTDDVTFWVGAGKNKNQDINSGEAVLVCDSTLMQTQELLKQLKRAKISYRRVVESSNLEVITQLVAQGAGIGIIPGRVAKNMEHLGLRKIPNAPVFKDELCVLYRVENRSVHSIQLMTDLLAESFKSK